MPLEDAKFIGSKEQCFLLAYRAVAWELYAKSASNTQRALRHALTYNRPELREFIDAFNFGVELGLRDAQTTKTAYDKVYESKNWSEVQGVIFEFETIFPIQCTGALFPHFDVDGALVQSVDITPKRPDTIAMLSFAADGRSYVCFCWLADDEESCQKFVAALKSKSHADLPAILGALLLQSIENCHISPSWYDSLPADGKRWCLQQMAIMGMLSPSATPSSSAEPEYFSGINIAKMREL